MWSPTGVAYYKKNYEEIVKKENSIQFAILPGKLSNCKKVYNYDDYKNCKDTDSKNPSRDYDHIGMYQKISDSEI